MQNKLLCIYQSFTIEKSLPQIINTKKHIKTACPNRLVVQHVLGNFAVSYLLFEGFKN